MLLEHINERYPVGYTAFTLPVPAKRFGKATYKENGKPALVLSEVGFAIYYPTEVGLSTERYPYLDWVIRPINNTVKGFCLLLGDLGIGQGREGAGVILHWIIWAFFCFFLSFIKVPVHNHAPVLPSPPKNEKPTRWPIVIFSPGLAGQLTTASHICARIASTGKVVIVMDHRDGSGAAAYPRNPTTGNKECLLYIPESGSSYGVGQRFAFRMEQLDLRRSEIYSAWDAFRRLVVDGEGDKLMSMDGIAIDWATFRDKIDFSSVQLVGHSFGGATLFHILSTPPDEGFTPLPISHALFLDPWLLPFHEQIPRPIDPDSGTKMLILHSEEFSLRKPRFLDLMLKVRHFWPNTPAYTIAGTNHVTFNDYMLVLPKRWRGMGSFTTRKAGDLVIGFLGGHLEETLSEFTIREFRTESAGNEKTKTATKLVAQPGDLAVHQC